MEKAQAQKIAIREFSPSKEITLHTEKEVSDYLQNNYRELNTAGSSIQLSAIKNSPYANYYTFYQIFNGIKIQDSHLKIAINKSGKVNFISGQFFNTEEWRFSSENNNSLIPATLALKFGIPMDVKGVAQIRVDENNIPGKYYVFDFQKTSDRSRISLILNERGELLEENDHRVYFSAQDTTVTGKVFSPDPLTSAESNYAGEYKDFDDADTVVLTAELTDVAFIAQLADGIFYLRNDSVVLTDLNVPTVPVVTSLTPEFNFTRSESGFEDVNTFYHITNLNKYILSLGYTDLQNFYIEIDPHGASGADQSFYVSAAVPSIQFGEGGVDDAEDADVIVHEYGHALSDQASPESNDGLERRAIDEGYGDYFAASYSRMFSDYHWNFIFNWDGHNEFWAGRNANTNKHYPEDNSADYYSSSEIWSGTLMDIFDAIGKENSDKLVLETLYGSFNNMTMPDAAQIILNSESTIFGGSYHETVFNILDARGLIDPVAIENNFIGHNIRINNTYGFAFNNEALIIELPQSARFFLQIFNAEGKVIYRQEGNEATISINPLNMSTGIYFLQISLNDVVENFTVERFNN